MIPSAVIRKQFIDFFTDKGHRFVPSAPVVPVNDPTLLFTNAGMNQFKNIFLGNEKPDYTRAVNSQKCIRAGGKHNDLDEVGKDGYHHTFFEMLGNWSFGDYYKKEAIQWAWELLTVVWKLPKDLLYATVHHTDDEALALWETETDIDHSHISKHGDKDNFWEMGETGPCGPCSEIHIDRGIDFCNKQGVAGHTCAVNGDCHRYIELWNLVFIQFQRHEDRSLTPLANKFVDTGAGFERLCQVLQGKSSNYDTDVFQPIIAGIQGLGISDNVDCGVPHRVIADHIRALTFAIADGGIPSNEGRGYVLRRILRRAARYGRKINLNEPFLYKLVDCVCDNMGEHFVELKTRKDFIKTIIKSEEERFNQTLDKGLVLFEEIASRDTINCVPNVISGKDAFTLYDTYGFPLDLTVILAEERGLQVDEAGFTQEMEKQKQRARDASNFKMKASDEIDWICFGIRDKGLGIRDSFVGYEDYKCETQIVKYAFLNEQEVCLILTQTPFYAESGGQIADTGYLYSDTTKIEITNVQKEGENFIHYGKIVSGVVEDTVYTAEIVSKDRQKTAANHTATHILHLALKKVLGEHIAQKGSLVTPERLRFDFTHHNAMTVDEIAQVERIVNDYIRQCHPVSIEQKPLEQARKDGAVALFGEKYGDTVRVVSIADSMELCGGTHTQNSGNIGLFKILSESSISAGIRRIEALTGEGASEYYKKTEHTLAEINSLLNTNTANVVDRIQRLLADNKDLCAQIEKLNAQKSAGALDELLQKKTIINGINLVCGIVSATKADDLKAMGDVLKEKLQSGVGVLVAEIDGKVSIIAVVTSDLVGRVQAGKLVGQLAPIVDGKGGGRPDMAMAGGKAVENMGKLIDAVADLINN